MITIVYTLYMRFIKYLKNNLFVLQFYTINFILYNFILFYTIQKLFYITYVSVIFMRIYGTVPII